MKRNRINKIYLVVFGLLFISALASGQRVMPVVINNDTTLTAGVYIADNNVLIGEDATLTFEPGSTLLLKENVVIKLEGGLIMTGTEHQYAQISSHSGTKKGIGLLISEISKKAIHLSKVQFHKLITPLEFQYEWHREKVTIENSEFKENESFSPGIFIRVPENIEVHSMCDFQFRNNAYMDNVGGIYLENKDQGNFSVRFENNFVYGNRAYGSGFDGMLTSPFFFRSDDDLAIDNFSLKSNVFMSNFILDSEYDTIIQEVNMGVAGHTSKVNIPNNYFGKGNIDQKTKKLDHFSNNNEAPFLQIHPELKTLPGNIPSMVNGVYINGERIDLDPNYLIENDSNLEMRLDFSGAVDYANSTPTINYVAYDEETDEEVSGVLETEVNWESNEKAVIKSKDTTVSRFKRIYFSLRGLISGNKKSVPKHTMGENGYKRYMALNHNGGLENLAAKNATGALAGDEAGMSSIDPILLQQILKRQDSLENILNSITVDKDKTYLDIIEETEKQILFAKFYKGSFEVGPFIGTSIYFGDLTGNDMFDPTDASLTLGITGKYNFTERWSLQAGLLYGKLKGDEADNQRGTSQPDRGLYFESPYGELSASLEYNINKLGFGDHGRFTPAISLGIGYFYFSPKAKSELLGGADVDLYNLYTAGADQTYSRTSLCIPFGFHIKSILKKRLMVDMSISWRYTFTDFIDDFGEPGIYRDKAFFDNKFGNQTMANGVRTADVAFELHQTRNPETYHNVGANRSGAANDWYIVAGLSITYIKERNKK